jgi:zinc transport system ATP-binding protein
MQECLLEIKSVSVAYGTNVVLRDINLKVFDNDFIGVIGPNGGGKTTLLKIILGLVKPLRGSVIYGKTLLETRNIGYLPQLSTGDNNFPVTVRDVILSGLMMRKGLITFMSASDKKRAAQVTDELGLNDLSKASLSELSGGQIQRVLLGRAIIGDPRLLLLDEPGNFVDTNFENDFYEKLRTLNRRMAIMMVSHDVGTISAYIKSFACINMQLHYHPSSEITNEELVAYGCPIQLITHGEVPHTVLKKH